MSHGANSARNDQSENRSWELLGDHIDQLVTVEIRPAQGSVPAGLVRPLYELCRRLQGEPLSTSAASLIAHRAGAGPIMIATGAGIPPALPAGETDGPPGAALLAATIRDSLHVPVLFVTETAHAPAVRSCAETAGFSTEDVILFPRTSSAESLNLSRHLLAEYEPSVVIFVERDGANLQGRYHGVRGDCRPRGAVARIDLLAPQAAERSIPVIAVGDGGNEVGFGAVRESVNDLFPGHGRCRDGCPSGRASNVPADLCLSASISNWGAYGIAAALAALRDPSSFPDEKMDRELLRACRASGARDGATGELTESVDGVPAPGSAAIVTLLSELVEKYAGTPL